MYVDIRLTAPYTHDDPIDINNTDVKEMIAKTKSFIRRDIINFYPIKYGAYCLEWINKLGELTRPHFHIILKLTEFRSKDSILKRMRTLFANQYNGDEGYEHFRGCHAYSVRVLDEPDDLPRYWRYLLKQHPLKFYEYRLPPCLTGNELQIQTHNAQAEYREVQKYTIERKKRGTVEQSKKYVMFREFKEKGITQEHHFAVEMIKFFQDKGSICPFTKMKDYWHTYQVYSGLMTPEEWVAQHY